MHYTYLLIFLCCLSCNNERILELPELENTEITEVLDVSPAYIFYDETQPDSTLLNRKNLIITTNWLVNVDKRLTLKQAIPHIQFLQDKKRNAELHKNKDAKNYFTCNDTSIGNLGFIDFTDVNYEFSEPKNNLIDLLSVISNDLVGKLKDTNTSKLQLNVNEKNKSMIVDEIINSSYLLENTSLPSEEIKTTNFSFQLYFDEHLSFQDYISIKSELLKLKSGKIIIDTNEFIY